MSKLLITHLHLRSAPGMRYGLDKMEFTPGLNIIFGPNASGKTTAARAMKTLLWQDSYKPASRISVYGGIEAVQSKFNIIRERGYSEIQKNGKPVDHLDLAIPDSWRIYDLSVTDLLASSDKEFAESIWREVMGGLDLKSASKNLKADTNYPSRRIQQYKNYEQSVKELRNVEKRQRELHEQKNKKQELNEELAEALEAGQQAELVGTLLEARELEQKRDDLQYELDQLPKVLDKLHGEEAALLEQLEKDLEEKQGREKVLKGDLEQLRHDRQKLKLPDEGLPEHKLSFWKEKLDQISEKHKTLNQSKDEIIKHQSKLKNVISRSQWDVSGDSVNLDSDKIDKLADWTRRWYEFQQEWSRITPEYEKLKDISRPDMSSEKVTNAITQLSHWLKQKQQDRGDAVTKKWSWGAIAIILVSIGLTQVSIIASIIAMVVAIAILLAGKFMPAKSDEEEIRFYEKAYRQTGLKEPDKWEVEEVSSLLDHLISQKSDLEEREKQFNRAEQLKSEVERLQEKRESLEENRNELLESIGIAPSDSEAATLQHMVEVLQQVKQTEDELQSEKNRSELLQQEINRLQEELIADMKEFIEVNIDSGDELHAFCEKLVERNRKYQDLTEKISKTEQSLSENREDQKDIERKIQKIQTKTGCKTSEELKTLLKRYSDYHQLKKQIGNHQARIQSIYEKLEVDDRFDPQWKQKDTTELDYIREDLTRKSEKAEQIRDTLSRLDENIKNEETSFNLETALANRDRARAELAQLRDEVLEKHMRKLVLDYLNEKHRNINYPLVFQDANRYFIEFTRGGFELDMDHDGLGFRARNSQTGDGLALDEISSGTRIQLLLAVRMAFISRREQGLALPLYADELLAVSDHQRADAIISGMQDMMREGRQLFYFTAQEEEVERWRYACRQENDLTEPNVISLTTPSPTFSVPWQQDTPDLNLQQEVPEPGRESYQQYLEKLNLKDFNPVTQSLNELPVWVLLETTEELYACLSRGIETWGMLKNWLISDIPLEGFSEKRKNELLELSKMLQEVLNLYRKGRPYPVELSDLQKADLVSAGQAAGIKELIEQVEYNPVTLLEHITTVSGVGKKKKEEVSEFLEANGYLPKHPKLEDGEFKYEANKIAATYGFDSARLEKILQRIF